MTKQVPRLLGVGLYSRADAVRLLRMTPSRVARWVKGYSYKLPSTLTAERRVQPPVVRVRLPRIGDTAPLTFFDLMELRVVKALIDQGLSLQHVRKAATLASSLFRTPYPFASRHIFTDGAEVFASLTREVPTLIELSSRHEQLIAAPIVEQYLTELDFDPQTSLARRWWPLGRQTPVVLDPSIAFGAPVVAGTATRTDIIAESAAGADAATVSSAYQISASAVLAAVRFESQIAMAA